MGQAKQRGTFEERKLKAQQRNIAIRPMIEGNPVLRKHHKRMGTQKLVTKLVMSGAFNQVK